MRVLIYHYKECVHFESPAQKFENSIEIYTELTRCGFWVYRVHSLALQAQVFRAAAVEQEKNSNINAGKFK